MSDKAIQESPYQVATQGLKVDIDENRSVTIFALSDGSFLYRIIFGGCHTEIRMSCECIEAMHELYQSTKGMTFEWGIKVHARQD